MSAFSENKKEYFRQYYAKYRRTEKGYTITLYSCMRKRQRKYGFKLENMICREEFYRLVKESKKFKKLFKDYENSQFKNHRIALTVDRVDSDKGYESGNIQFLPKWLNSKKMSIETGGSFKTVKLINVFSEEELIFSSIKAAANFLDVSNIRVANINNKPNTVKGFRVFYATNKQDLIPKTRQRSEICVENVNDKSIKFMTVSQFSLLCAIGRQNLNHRFKKYGVVETGKYVAKIVQCE